jgi:outer membrane protein assembly factor BamE (lipoprotein component of BamABCDE complex)
MLVLGIMSIIVGPPIVSIITWVMARTDLKEMDAGRMDPEGRSQTQLACLLAILSTIGWPVIFSCCCMCLIANQAIQGGRFLSAIGSRRITNQEFERIEFGMTKTQVREILGSPAKAERNPNDRINWYWYEKNGRTTFQVTFDRQDRVEGMGKETPD